MQREENAALDDALAKLPVEQREIVLLHYMDGQTRRDIAANLGVHPATVGRHLDAALSHLKGTLDPVLRQHFQARKPNAPALARAGALIGAFAAISGTARAELLGGAAWRQGDSIVSEAMRQLGTASAKAATTTAKGAIVMAKQKVIAGVVLGLLVAGSAGTVAVKIGAEYQASRQVPAMPENIAPETSISQAPLPPLPKGWKLEVKPAQRALLSSTTDNENAIVMEGLNLTNAIHYWDTEAFAIDPAVSKHTERYDFKLTAPPNVKREEFDKALRVEFQRLYGFRAAVEKRAVPALVLRSKGGKPVLFKPPTGYPVMSTGLFSISMHNQSMATLAKDIALNRNLPVFDETGITDRFDVEIPSSGAAAWSDAGLEKLGLQVSHENREADVLFAVPASAAAQ